MRYIQDINEKKRILEMHSKMKKVPINEQVEDLKGNLQSMIDNGFIKSPATVVQMQTTNPKLQFAVKKESVKTPGTFKYFFVDGRVGSFVNNKFVFDKNKWNVAAFEEFLRNKKIQNATTTNRTEIDRVKQEQGWKERGELNVSDVDLANENRWEKTQVAGVTLYREKARVTASTGYSEDVNSILTYLRNQGWQTAEEVPAFLRIPTNSKKVSELHPDWKQYFPTDITMYYNDEVRTQTGPDDTGRLKTVLKSIENLTEDQCKDKIDELYQGYRYSPASVPTPELSEKVKQVQYCVRKFDFDKLIYSKTRRKIFVLAGYSSKNDVGTPRNSPYRITLPNNYKPE